MFANRTEAGQKLGDELAKRGIAADLVLGIPRGGLPVADAVADRLDAPLDIVVAKKIALPYNMEYAIGAVTADNDVWYNQELIDELNVDDEELATQREKARQRAEEKREAFRDSRSPPEMAGKRVAIVDDGIATGATMRACIRAVDEAGAGEIIVAVPVASPTSVPELELEADRVIALYTPERFRAVGQYYDTFDQVSTEEAVEYLDQAAAAD